MVRSVGRGLDPSAGGCPGDGYWRKVSRGVGDAAPTVCPGMGGSGRPPLIRPCGATFPRGGRQGLQGRDSVGVGDAPPTACPGMGGSGRPRRGGGTPPYVWGDMETLWGLRGHPFPGRRAVGAGHARPGGLRGHPSMVRSVGRGLDPSAGGYLGMAVGGRFRGASGTPPLRFARGMGGSGRPPLIRPCGATFPRGGRQGLLLAAAGACPYPGSWSSVRSWRVRL